VVLLCLHRINYCISYSLVTQCLGHMLQNYQDQCYYKELNQTGLDSNINVLEAWNDWDLTEYVEYIYMNSISCSILIHNTGLHLVYEDGKVRLQ